MAADDESNITELSFLPDGRICVFGMSREVLELLGELALGDPALARRYECLRQAEVGGEPCGSVGNGLRAVPPAADERPLIAHGTAPIPFPTECPSSDLP